MGNKSFAKKEFTIGIIGIAALLTIYLIINFFKGINLFDSGDIYYLQFERIGKISNSSPVYINGYKAGNVKNIAYNFEDNGDIVITVSIDEKIKLPAESYAKITTQVLGDSEISIIPMGEGGYISAGDTLPGVADLGIMSEMGEKMGPIFNDLLPKVDTLLTHLNTVISNPAITQILANSEQLTAELNATTKELKNLLNGDIPEITERMIEIEDNVAKVSGELAEVDYRQFAATLDSTLSNLHNITSALNNGEGTAGQLLKDTTLYSNLNSTCQEAESLLKDLRENPKRYVHFSIFGKKEQKENE